MKFAPPGSEQHRVLTRLDGWIGHDPYRMPISIATEIAAALPPLEGRRTIERIRARMMARQLAYERAKQVRLARRRKFGLETR